MCLPEASGLLSLLTVGREGKIEREGEKEHGFLALGDIQQGSTARVHKALVSSFILERTPA